MTKTKIIHRGSSFTGFLRENGIDEEVEAAAPKKVIAAALTKQMDRVVSLCRPSPKDGA